MYIPRCIGSLDPLNVIYSVKIAVVAAIGCPDVEHSTLYHQNGRAHYFFYAYNT